MGVIRILLALAVVCANAGVHPAWQGPGAAVAVQTFFMVSGFHVAMALGTAYRDAELNFWLNRALRIYPAYLVVALVALLGKSWTQPGFFSGFASLPGAAQVLVLLSNLAIVGQDWVMFAGVRDGALAVMTDATAPTPMLNEFLLNPPAWWLGTALGFYLLAPFLFRLRARTLLLLIAASVALRVALASQGLTRGPWSHGFFLTELATFLAGGLAYRATPRLRQRFGPVRVQRLGRWATWLVIGCTVAYGVLPGGGAGWHKPVAFYLLVLLCLPFIFVHTSARPLDRAIGALAYPLYISHWVTLAYLNALFGAPHGLGALALRVLTAVAVAYLLYRVVDRPVQRLRDMVRSATASSRMRIREPWPTTLR